MQSLTSTIRRVVLFGGAITLGLTVMGGVASATPSGERGKAPDQTTTVTEDNDTNDGDTPNNVVDDGDNAHPSGKDRSVEQGRSGNQGKASHDPDGDGNGPDRTNGGIDQPGGAGGVDDADQDGNNGCGNDDDFEDDNEGWCGKPKATEPTVDQAPPAVVATSVAPPPATAVLATEIVVPTPAPAPAEAVVAAAQDDVIPAQDQVVAAQDQVVAAQDGAVPTQVLGVTLERTQAERPTEVLGVTHERGVLARTGTSITMLLLIAVALVTIGIGCKRLGRTA